MAKCEVCGKGVAFGIKLSHSHRRTNRTFKPNVQRIKAIVDGTPCRVNACTRCLRSGKVVRNVKEIKVADVPVVDVSAALDAIAEG
jgi:large subunit ribosomal protein L28